MEVLHKRQMDSFSQILKLISNYRKSGKDRLTKGFIETRLEKLEAYWESFEEGHKNIIIVSTSEQTERYDYFTKDVYDTCLDAYLELKTLMKDKLSEITTPKMCAAQTSDHVEQQPCTKLPAIQLPTFSGDYRDWLSFHDLYKSLVHDNNNISKVNKCQYLKSSLRGEAEGLVRQIQVTDTNYEIIWDMLTQRYNNKRSIVNSYLARFLNQKRIVMESAKAIRELLDVTRECLSTLKGLKLPTDTWDDLIVYILIQKLDPESHRMFEQRLESNDQLPTWKDLSTFLEFRFRTLEALKHKESPNTKVMPPTRSYTAKLTSPANCAYCKGDHLIFKCKEFHKLELYPRKEFVQKNMLCFNCLRKGHSVTPCLQSTTCQKCGRKHHTLLHGYVPYDAIQTTVQEPQTMTTLTHTTQESSTFQSQVILATALVSVQSQRDNTIHTLRALIDQGSQACLITEAACQVLGLKRTPIKGEVSGIGSSKSTTRARVELEILYKNENPKPRARVSAYVLRSLTSYVPEREHTIHWPQLRELELADPTFLKPGKIDLILGADVYADILQEGIITLKNENNTLIAQKTTLGWLISGKSMSMSSNTLRVHIHHVKVELDTLLRQFWEIEENTHNKRTLTNLEVKCEKHYEVTHQRLEDGSYKVRMPFVTHPPEIGESLTQATKRLVSLERRLRAQPDIYKRYNEFMSDYEQQGHMEQVSPPDGTKEVCYLPHHAVINEQHLSTKLRVVFDSSAKTSNGKSLNNNLMIGPALQNDIRDVTLRWRRHRVVIVGDIRQMFRRISMDERDRDYQRIIWRFNSEEIRHFRLATVTYGTSCAPYLAIKTLRQVAEDERINFGDEVADTVLKDFYTDDWLSGHHSLASLKELKQNLTNMLDRGGFQLHKWASNSTEIEGAEQDTRKILGISWNGQTDQFELKLDLPTVNVICTKRTVLCEIASTYDPTGWLAPIVVVAKGMLQKLWIDKLDWDDTLPDHLLQEWQKYCTALREMPTITLRRWIGFTEDLIRVELHGFSDASTKAYSAVVYCRVITPDGITVTIIEAKTRVAPIKQVSLPRLELCGAVLLVKLVQRVQVALCIPSQDIYAWTDATIVLAWLQRSPSYWTTFVANRVTEIINVLDKERWHHVMSQENPADVASRGISPAELPHHNLWWRGPDWLHQRDALPLEQACSTKTTELEKRSTTNITVHNSVISANTGQSIEYCIMDRYSTLTKLVRIVAYILRFYKCLQHKINTRARLECTSYLTTQELHSSFKCLIKMSQNKDFIREINTIRDNTKSKYRDLKRLDNGKKISCFDPYIDNEQILRIGGRIHYSNLSEDHKHPMILSKHSKLSFLIVKDAHYRTFHGGIQLMLNYIQSKFHIIGVKSLTKGIIHGCISCCRHSPKLSIQMMGNLPKERVTPQRPFSVSGIDFAGPVTLKVFSGRGSKTTLKGYIALFICTAVKAVHLELVTSLSSDAFLAAFRRFTARRGHCHKLLSDCGTNFIGASKELKELFCEANKNLPLEITSLLANDGTEWQFNPAGAPHMGGLWEANIKSVKFHLNRVLNESKLTYEEYSTLLCQIESCLNSRPLTPLSDESDYALTPGHFLIGEPPIVVPNQNLENIKIPYLQRWTYIQQMLQSFWKKWSYEYLIELQKRHKWTSVQDNFKIGNIVLVKDGRLPPSKWLMGRIVEVHPGSDSLVRVVTIKCKQSLIKRLVHKLCLLPIDI